MGNEFINAVGMMGKVMETLQKKRKQVQKCPRFQTVQIVEAREAANRLHLISDKGHTHTTLRERKTRVSRDDQSKDRLSSWISRTILILYIKVKKVHQQNDDKYLMKQGLLSRKAKINYSLTRSNSQFCTEIGFQLE